MSWRLTSVVWTGLTTAVSVDFAAGVFLPGVAGSLPFGFERDDLGRFGFCIVEERVVGRGEGSAVSTRVEVEAPGVLRACGVLVAFSGGIAFEGRDSTEMTGVACTARSASAARCVAACSAFAFFVVAFGAGFLFAAAAAAAGGGSAAVERLTVVRAFLAGGGASGRAGAGGGASGEAECVARAFSVE